jgi:hypothetical protein
MTFLAQRPHRRSSDEEHDRSNDEKQVLHIHHATSFVTFSEYPEELNFGFETDEIRFIEKP